MAVKKIETTVGPGEAALIVATDGDLRIIIPDPDEYPELHANAVLLGVVAVRAHDPEWVKEMLEFYDGKPN